MASWHHASWRRFPAEHLALRAIAAHQPELVAVRCRLTSIPESSSLPSAQPLATIPQGIESKFKADATHIRDRNKWVRATGRVAVRVDGHVLGVGVGDVVQIFGSLTIPASPMNPGQHDGRIAGRTERMICRLDAPYPDCVSLIEATSRGPASQIGRTRSRGLALLDEFVGAPRGVLAGALLLGARDRLEPERTEVFFHTGTIHLLAISGLHVGILAWGFFVIAKNTSLRRWALVLLACLTVVYCLLTGMRAPVLRASILVQVVCIGLIWRRTVLAYNALATAAISSS